MMSDEVEQFIMSLTNGDIEEPISPSDLNAYMAAMRRSNIEPYSVEPNKNIQIKKKQVETIYISRTEDKLINYKMSINKDRQLKRYIPLLIGSCKSFRKMT